MIGIDFNVQVVIGITLKAVRQPVSTATNPVIGLGCGLFHDHQKPEGPDLPVGRLWSLRFPIYKWEENFAK